MFDEIGAACVETTVDVTGPKGRPGRRTTSASTVNRRPTPFLNDIRDLAHRKWTSAGRPPGDCTRFWLEAEQEIREAR
jgi:Protein of unknown function (DUF2934)